MAAASATQTIKVGSGICLMQEHDPIKLAKEVATVDQLSNGRLLLGIGGGWNAEEMENHGTPFDRRWKILRGKIEAKKAIWTNSHLRLGEQHAGDHFIRLVIGHAHDHPRPCIAEVALKW